MSAPVPDRAPGDTRGVSVIATVRDEVDSIEGLVAGLLGGDRAPDEIVISDAGSSDGTREVLERFALDDPRVVVLDVPGNRSLGRNSAIAAATHDRIASIDGGCMPDRGWLAALIAPMDRGARWVGGFYRPVGTSRQVCIGLTMVFVLEEALGAGFIPSARSMAFSREAWELVGGFPEHLDVSEDTAFDEAMIEAGVAMEFAPDAVVSWTPPAGFVEQARVVFRWSLSDGLAGIRGYGYRWEASWVAGAMAVAVAAGLVVPIAAFLGLAPLVVLMIHQTRAKFRWAPPGAGRWVWLPTAWFVGLSSRLLGFTIGWSRRRLRRGAT